MYDTSTGESPKSMKKEISKYDKERMAHLTQAPRLGGQAKNAGLRSVKKQPRSSQKGKK